VSFRLSGFKHEAGNCDHQAHCEHCYWITQQNYHGNIANSSVETRLLAEPTDGEGDRGVVQAGPVPEKTKILSLLLLMIII